MNDTESGRPGELVSVLGQRAQIDAATTMGITYSVYHVHDSFLVWYKHPPTIQVTHVTATPSLPQI